MHIIYQIVLNYNQYLYNTKLQICSKMNEPKSAGEQLRLMHTRDNYIQQNHNQDEYFQRLKKLGLQLHESLFPAYFALKNGKQYPGMATKQQIKSNEILVKVPQRLILSSVKALQQPQLSQVYQHSYYKDQNCWEDRVLLTYCLFLLSKKPKDSIFYEMILHMSKDIDVLFTWSASQLQKFIDKSIKYVAQQDQRSFEQEWKLFSQVQKKYSILQSNEFTYENYKWIFIHIESRGFGKTMDYTSFVPFCQFFNHHSSTVYYQIDCKKKIRQEQSELDETSSNGSNQSQQYIQDGDYAYDEINAIAFKWGSKQCFNLKNKQKETIAKISQRLLQKLQTQIDWKDFSILFAGHFITKVKMIQNQYIEGRQKFQNTKAKLEDMMEILQRYANLIKQFYQLKKGKKFVYEISNRQNLQQKKIQQASVAISKQYKPQYTTFYLKTGKRDNFWPNNQVFFCYGRNSNRTLLLRYGFAIQGNKYQHYWLKFLLKDILKQMPDLLVRIEKLGLSISRKFRINFTNLNLDLIIFCRLQKWNLYNIKNVDEIFFVKKIQNQISVLQHIVKCLLRLLQDYRGQQQQQLKNKQLSYHEYFIKVYNIEKKKILEKQIQIHQKLISVLVRMDKGDKLQQACFQMTTAEKKICKNYFKWMLI